MCEMKTGPEAPREFTEDCAVLSARLVPVMLGITQVYNDRSPDLGAQRGQTRALMSCFMPVLVSVHLSYLPGY